jgi:beta-galactosidase
MRSSRSGASPDPSRRTILRGGVLGATALASLATLGCDTTPTAPLTGATRTPEPAGTPERAGTPEPAGTPEAQDAFTYDLNQNWLFGGAYVAGSEAVGYQDSGFAQVTLPHTVVPLSWGNWDQTDWENVWIYRKHFSGAVLGHGRVLVDFDGAMVNATVVINGTSLGTHAGGYLPWSVELTPHLNQGDNVLAVIVDSRWLNVPPNNPPGGAGSIDYLQPGGIYRDVTLRILPEVFISDVFARPENVLAASRSVVVQATIDAAARPAGPLQVTAELLDGSKQLATASATAAVTAAGTTVVQLTITGIGDVSYCSPQTPRLYTVRTTLSSGHSVTTTIGFREAVFKVDGFYLNGERHAIFGLNRHQLFPYIGMAAPARLQWRDAEILRNELNCTMVRCSHYPPSPHFLDACDQLGLMVWEEPPGWGYIGDAAFQGVVLQNVHDMVIRDRNRPSVIVWGTRLNETPNDAGLYEQTRQLAYQLDGSRQTSGTMTSSSLAGWAEDVFALDDYQSSGGNAVLAPPVPGVPYFVSEAVGALDGSRTYRWIDSGATLATQGRMHAQVHNIAQSDTRYAGLLGWCGIDYASITGGNRIWSTLKTPGVTDTFRVPKPGAAFYRSQVSPAAAGPVILPMFFWDFGPSSPRRGPGAGSMIATNCDRLEVYVGGIHVATGTPDTLNYGSLAYPPVVVDLTVDGTGLPELQVNGYLGTQLAATLLMSANPRGDRLQLTADDATIIADGSDATRITFRAVDAYGNHRPGVTGSVALSLAGPATLISQNPFQFGEYGGVGGGFIRSLPGKTGPVQVTAAHATLGQASVQVTVTAAE